MAKGERQGPLQHFSFIAEMSHLFFHKVHTCIVPYVYFLVIRGLQFG
jgi:hypothetical protein